jgi:hypothetical protein
MAAQEEYDDAQVVEGGIDARAKILKFLSPLIRGTEVEGDVRVTLFQMAKLGEKPVDDFIYELGSGQSIDAFVGDIVDVAENDAMEVLGKVRYAVRAEGKAGRCPFTLTVPTREGTDDEETPDELPSQKGLAHQAMRHAEVFAKEMLSSARMNSGLLMSMLKDAREENHILKKNQFEQIKITEQLRSMQFARDIKVDELKEQKERKEKLMGMAMKAAPVVMSKLLGGGAQMAAEMGASPIEGIIEGLVTSLERQPEKFAALQQILDPVDLMALGELHAFVAQRREQAKASSNAAAAAPAPQPNPTPGQTGT